MVENVFMLLDFYGMVFLSVYVGVWSLELVEIMVMVQDVVKMVMLVEYFYIFMVGVNLLLVLGLVVEIENCIVFFQVDMLFVVYMFIIQLLLLVDFVEVVLGFLIINVM